MLLQISNAGMQLEYAPLITVNQIVLLLFLWANIAWQSYMNMISNRNIV